MDRYAQLLMDLVTKPKTATSTSTTTATQPKQGLDLSSLLMMLMFSGIFDKDKNKVAPDMSPAMPVGGFGTASGIQTPGLTEAPAANQWTIQQIMNMLRQ